jgi:hypothetical protein
LFGRPEVVVYPVTDPVEVTEYLNDTNPPVKVLGLTSCMLVFVLSHCIIAAGRVYTLGVGFTVTEADTGFPTQNVVAGPVGIIVKVTIIGLFVVFEKTPEILSPSAEPDNGRFVIIPAGLVRVQPYVVPVTLLIVPKTISINPTPGHSF